MYDVLNLFAFVAEVCTAVLEGRLNLKCLVIWYTGSAEAIADGDYALDISYREVLLKSWHALEMRQTLLGVCLYNSTTCRLTITLGNKL